MLVKCSRGANYECLDPTYHWLTRLTLSDLPTAPEYNVPFEMGTRDGKPVWRTGRRSRNTAMKLGQYCFRWERPPQSRLLNKAESNVK